MKYKVSFLAVIFFLILQIFSIECLAGTGTEKQDHAIVKFCSDENPQFPILFLKNNVPTGIYPDLFELISKNLYKKESLRISFIYNLKPWNRCLEELKEGLIDAALTASYKPERAEFLIYPKDEDHEGAVCSSKYKIICNEFVVVTHKSRKFVYSGDPKTIPPPVRTARGYSVGEELKKAGVEVEAAKGEPNIIQQLLRDKKGSAVVTGVIARHLLKDKTLNKELEIQEKPFIKKSYYIPFSKKSTVSENVRLKIWEEMSNIMNKDTFLIKGLSKYEKY